MERPESNPSQIYEITVRSELGERWPRLLDGLGHTVEVRGGSPEASILRVAVQDQAALRGLLNQLWDLNLTLVSLHRIVPQREGA
jgi:hypothetical protein